MRAIVPAFAALSGLGACDVVKFPGFDDREGEGRELDLPAFPVPPHDRTIGPPPQRDPVAAPDEPDASEDRAPSVADGGAPGAPALPPDKPEAGEAADAARPPEDGVAPTDEAGLDAPDLESDDIPPPERPGEQADTDLDPNETAEVEAPAPPVEPAFSYHPPGALVAGSGDGAVDETVYAPDMVFPIDEADAFPQSMVWGFGGGIGGGDECDPRNYRYPWRDNFCEKRSSNFNTPFCPSPRVHLGQDIRVGTPEGCEELRRTPAAERTLYRVVAAEEGVISNIGSYTVNVRTNDGRIYRYLHMNMRALQVGLGDDVVAGQHLGYVSKDFGGTPTTFHLHFEIKQNTAEGWAYVPPYTSLVKAYERREGGPGRRIEPDPSAVAIASEPLPIPEGFVFTE